MTKTPLILGSGERSATKGFGMRKVTKFQETSVVTLGFQLPTPTCKSVWHLSPTSTTRGPFLQSCHNFLLSSPHIFSRAFPPHPCPVRGLAGSTLTQSLLCHNPVPSHISQARYPGHGKTCQEKTFQNQARGGKVCQHVPPLPFAFLLLTGILPCVHISGLLKVLKVCVSSCDHLCPGGSTSTVLFDAAFWIPPLRCQDKCSAGKLRAQARKKWHFQQPMCAGKQSNATTIASGINYPPSYVHPTEPLASLSRIHKQTKATHKPGLSAVLIGKTGSLARSDTPASSTWRIPTNVTRPWAVTAGLARGF